MNISCKRLLVTGGAGFIGSSFIRLGLKLQLCEKIINLDCLTYASNLQSLSSVDKDPRYSFVKGDINDIPLLEAIIKEHQIDTIINFAAESHVDRSIENAQPFLYTNVLGTAALLEIVRVNRHIHFHQVSTDEVYGSLGPTGAFTEESPHRPNSPYAASKAAADHLVRSFTHTYNLSTTLSHCSNNYGPYQHAEKFIPRMITYALQKKPLPLYGNGLNRRDWLFVDDHAEALWLILKKGKSGEIYDIGAGFDLSNIEMLDHLLTRLAKHTQQDPPLITYIEDRPGHDFRYAIDATKITKALGWRPRHTLEQGLDATICSLLKRSPASSLHG